MGSRNPLAMAPHNPCTATVAMESGLKLHPLFVKLNHAHPYPFYPTQLPSPSSEPLAQPSVAFSAHFSSIQNLQSCLNHIWGGFGCSVECLLQGVGAKVGVSMSMSATTLILFAKYSTCLYSPARRASGTKLRANVKIYK